MKAVCEKFFIPERNPNLFLFKDNALSESSLNQNEKTDPSPLNSVAAMLAQQEQATQIKIDEVDNVVDSSSKSTPHCGPIEGKILRGSDGRDYILEFMRVTPRDANFVQVRFLSRRS